jgi:hypothetical protein
MNRLNIMRIIYLLLFLPTKIFGQQSGLQFFRPNNKLGINYFDINKIDTVPFSGIQVKIGGNFTQDFQSLNHSNRADSNLVNNINKNQLMALTNGFNLAMANLNLDAQLADGIRMNLTLYLSSRHHKETWVKGGYVQFDKLPFFKSKLVDSIMKSVTIKVGDYDVNYGDQHFRRTDGGNAIYNPFIENYIMDEFTTEIGGEILYHPKCGLIVMIGVTNGALNPTVIKSNKIDSATGKVSQKMPSIISKIGYDKQLNENFRFRLTGSLYAGKNASSQTLFFGDRTGSHYYFVLENTSATSDANAWSGRYNPQFSQQITAIMINPFVKYRGIELFGTYEWVNGKSVIERTMRTTSQYAVDLVYRFPKEKELFWLGLRYNALVGQLPFSKNEIMIKRGLISAGWFVTKHLLMKAEYVNQTYLNFNPSDIRSGGKFNGFTIEASVGF